MPLLSRRFLSATLLSLSFTLAHAAPEREEILALFKAGRDAAALQAARKWTITQPDSPEALLLYAAVQEACGDIEGALDSLDSAYFLTQDPMILVRKGRVFLQSGQYALAERQFREALRQQEGLVPAHVGLVEVFLARQQLLEAEAALQAVLRLDPRSVEARVALAQLRVKQGQIQAARELLKQALQDSPEASSPYLVLGNLEAEAGNIASAREYWRRYVALEPVSAASWLLREHLFPVCQHPFDCPGYYPAFAPDGRRLAFRGRGDAGTVYIAPLTNRSATERIYASKGTVYSLHWSPNSQWLLCREYAQEQVAGQAQYTYRLILLSAAEKGAATPAPRLLYEGRYIGAPAWLPDSRAFLFDGFVPGKGRPLLRLSLAAPAATPPEIALLPEKDEAFSGCWILPHELPNTAMALPRLLVHRWHALSREYQLVLVNPQDRRQDQILVRSSQSLLYAALSPDGRFFLYFRRAGQPPTWTLMALPLNEPDVLPHPLPVTTPSPMPPALSADGHQLVYYAARGLMICDLEGI